jgi:hypothetical protein
MLNHFRTVLLNVSKSAAPTDEHIPVGFVARPIRRLSFWLLNALSISLVFANPVVAAVAIPGVLLILLWHSRPLPNTA